MGSIQPGESNLEDVFMHLAKGWVSKNVIDNLGYVLAEFVSVILFKEYRQR